ncbi:MAG: cellulase family glycosylhydrolase [Gammaproteobacteria bacterium]|nr:cellulase family glycosylhydrolase [Gammaproteobacteria bacterium]
MKKKQLGCIVWACFFLHHLNAENQVSVSAKSTYQSVTEVYSAGPNVRKPVMIPAVTDYGQAPFYRGVTLSGLEYPGTFESAILQRPDLPDARYFVAQGMNFIRLPIRAEFILPNPDDKANLVNEVYLGAVYDTLQKYLASGLTVELDLHNSMRFCANAGGTGPVGDVMDPVNQHCVILTPDQLSHLWTLILTAQLIIPGIDGVVRIADLAERYPTQLMLGVMNQPFDYSPAQSLSTAALFTAEVAAAKAIQAVAPKNIIILSGNGFDSLRTWMSPITGNSKIFTLDALKAQKLDVSKIVIEVQQFFDWSYNGRNQACNHYSNYLSFEEDVGVLDGAGTDIFGAWMKQNKMPVFLTEFGGADTLADGSPNQDCRQDIIWMLQYVDTHAYDDKNAAGGGFVGWALWHANRHNQGEVPFNFLQQADSSVYDGKGIAQGSANGLMPAVISKYLVPPK